MGTQGDGSGDGGAGGADTKKDDIYENRPRHKKIVRVVTVMAYMVSVSFVAIVLSAYYVFLWQPPNPRLMHRSHLRADPQVEYLVHGPPTGSADDVPQDDIEGLDRVIVLGENISVGTEREKSTGRSKSPKVSEVDPRSKEENEIGDDRQTRAGNPIVRALLATTEKHVETLPDSTGVYERVEPTMKSSLMTETSNSEIGRSTTRSSSHRSMATIQSGDESYGSVNYSGSIVERVDELYEESVNHSTPIGFDNSSESSGADVGSHFGELMRKRANESLENSKNFRPEVQTILFGTLETSEKSRPVEAQPETLGINGNGGPDFGESTRKRANESLENLRNFTPEVQPILIGSVETSGKSGPDETLPEMLGNFGPDFGEPMGKRANENSTNFTPEVQPIPVGSVETSGKSGPVEARAETLGTTANVGPRLGEPTRKRANGNSTNLTPEMQPISIGSVETSVKSRPVGTTANVGPHFGDPLRKKANESLANLKNFTPEVQPIAIGTVETSGKSRPAEAQPETLGNFAPDFGEPMRKRTNENSTNFTPEVQPIPIGTVETSVKSRPVGTTANVGPHFGDPLRKKANESLANLKNFTPEVQPIAIGTVETSGKSRPAEAQPETLGNFAPDFGEPMRKRTNENSTNFTPEVQPIPIGSVETSVKSRPVGTTANVGPHFGDPLRKKANESLANLKNFTPEVQPIAIGTVETSGISRPAGPQPETLGTNANFDQNFGEPMSKTSNESLENSTNFTSEVQPISIGVEEQSVWTVETSGKSRPAEAQPETLGTTAAFERQRGSDWKPLGFTVLPTKPGSPIKRVEAKSPINDTETVGKFSSTLEANEDVPIEMIAGPAGDAELGSEQSASAVPAVVQPEPDYVDK